MNDGIAVAVMAAVGGKYSKTVAGTMMTLESDEIVAINDGAI